MIKKRDWLTAVTMIGLAASGVRAAGQQPSAAAIAAPDEGQAIVEGVAYRVAGGLIERREADGSWRPFSSSRGWLQVLAFKGTLFSLNAKAAFGTLGGEITRWDLRTGQSENLASGADKIAADDQQLVALIEGRLWRYSEQPTVSQLPMGGVPGGYSANYSYFNALPEGRYRITDLLEVTRDGAPRIMVQLNGGPVVGLEERDRPVAGAIPKGGFERFMEQFR